MNVYQPDMFDGVIYIIIKGDPVNTYHDIYQIMFNSNYKIMYRKSCINHILPWY